MNVDSVDKSNYKDYIKEYIVKRLNTSYRTVNIVSGWGNEYNIVYSISNERVVREDAKFQANVARLLKVLVPGPLITGIDYLKEDARCILSLNVLEISGNLIKFEYDISVCNGSSIDKKRIRNSELYKMSNVFLRTEGLCGFRVDGL